MVEKLQPELGSIKGYVILTDVDHMPASTTLHNVMCYESLVCAHSHHYKWPVLDENLACGLCYTSGTTGNPKVPPRSRMSANDCAIVTDWSTRIHTYDAQCRRHVARVCV